MITLGESKNTPYEVRSTKIYHVDLLPITHDGITFAYVSTVLYLALELFYQVQCRSDSGVRVWSEFEKIRNISCIEWNLSVSCIAFRSESQYGITSAAPMLTTPCAPSRTWKDRPAGNVVTGEELALANHKIRHLRLRSHLYVLVRLRSIALRKVDYRK